MQRKEIDRLSQFLLQNPAEAAPTACPERAEGPPNSRAWEPGQLVLQQELTRHILPVLLYLGYGLE